MGIYKGYDEQKKMWYWKGFMFRKYYKTETECDADKDNVFYEHMNRLDAWNIIADLLCNCCSIRKRY